ncbi:outer membrane beta-barrel protein [Lacibacter sp. H375]|uniref:outer membrane beta-barrel protein n=1 Tax=Lacibacter sp. H375 TaxID=3133424 RepID=UPI0030C2F947
MKKKTLIVLLTVLTLSLNSFAQSTAYTPWQVDFMGGYAAASGKGTKGGIALYLEPKYHINDNFSAGLRLGGALTLKYTLDASGEEIGEASVAAVASYLATGDYYFQKEAGAKFRPFAGIGLGFASAAGATATATEETAETQTKNGFSGMVRAGFDVSHFRFNLEYDVNPKTGRISNNYIGVNLGFYIGGGSRN